MCAWSNSSRWKEAAQVETKVQTRAISWMVGRNYRLIGWSEVTTTELSHKLRLHKKGLTTSIRYLFWRVHMLWDWQWDQSMCNLFVLFCDDYWSSDWHALIVPWQCACRSAAHKAAEQRSQSRVCDGCLLHAMDVLWIKGHPSMPATSTSATMCNELQMCIKI